MPKSRRWSSDGSRPKARGCSWATRPRGSWWRTATAAHQAWYAAVNALFGTFRWFKTDYRVIPWARFTEPEIARVGLNEQEAREKQIPHVVSVYPISDLDRAIADEEAHGFVKVLTKPGTDRILGVTIAGEHAGDLLAEYVLAMKHGLGLNKILGTIHTYPTKWGGRTRRGLGARCPELRRALLCVELQRGAGNEGLSEGTHPAVT